jgi:hypothetical protein
MSEFKNEIILFDPEPDGKGDYTKMYHISNLEYVYVDVEEHHRTATSRLTRDDAYKLALWLLGVVND